MSGELNCQQLILLKNPSDQKQTVENTTKTLHPHLKSRSYRILERRFLLGFLLAPIAFKKRGFFSRINNLDPTPFIGAWMLEFGVSKDPSV